MKFQLFTKCQLFKSMKKQISFENKDEKSYMDNVSHFWCQYTISQAWISALNSGYVALNEK